MNTCPVAFFCAYLLCLERHTYYCTVLYKLYHKLRKPKKCSVASFHTFSYFIRNDVYHLHQCFSTGGPKVVSKGSASWVRFNSFIFYAVLLQVLSSFFVTFYFYIVVKHDEKTIPSLYILASPCFIQSKCKRILGRGSVVPERLTNAELRYWTKYRVLGLFGHLTVNHLSFLLSRSLKIRLRIHKLRLRALKN
jgi:hypothetical protein